MLQAEQVLRVAHRAVVEVAVDGARPLADSGQLPLHRAALLLGRAALLLGGLGGRAEAVQLGVTGQDRLQLGHLGPELGDPVVELLEMEQQPPPGLGTGWGVTRGGHAAASPETRTRASSRAWAAPLSIALAAPSIPAAMLVARSAA